jgi:hypothetical protein
MCLCVCVCSRVLVRARASSPGCDTHPQSLHTPGICTTHKQRERESERERANERESARAREREQERARESKSSADTCVQQRHTRRHTCLQPLLQLSTRTRATLCMLDSHRTKHARAPTLLLSLPFAPPPSTRHLLAPSVTPPPPPPGPPLLGTQERDASRGNGGSGLIDRSNQYVRRARKRGREGERERGRVCVRVCECTCG